MVVDFLVLLMLVGGFLGVGKFLILWVIVVGCVYRDDVALVLIDFKWVELLLWGLWVLLVVVEFEDCMVALRVFVVLIDVWYRDLECAGVVVWICSLEWFVVVVVVDELAELLDMGDRVDIDWVCFLCCVLFKGRVVGVVVVVVM